MTYLVNSLRGKINFRKKFKHCLTLEEDLWSGFHHLWSKCYLSKLKADNRYQNNRHRIQRVPGEEITYRCNWAYSWNDTIKAGAWLTLILHQNRSPTKFFVLFYIRYTYWFLGLYDLFSARFSIRRFCARLVQQFNSDPMEVDWKSNHFRCRVLYINGMMYLKFKTDEKLNYGWNCSVAAR